MNNLSRVRDRIREAEKATDNYDLISVYQILENLLFEDYATGPKETQIELAVALLARMPR